MKHLDVLGNPNYDERAFIKGANGKIKLYGGKSAPTVSAPPPPTVTPPPKKEFTPVTPEDTSMETDNKTGIRGLRIDLGGAKPEKGLGNIAGNGLNISKDY